MALEVWRHGYIPDEAPKLEAENARLKKMYAEERIKAELRQLACVVYGISETCYRYQAKLDGENAVVAD